MTFNSLTIYFIGSVPDFMCVFINFGSRTEHLGNTSLSKVQKDTHMYITQTQKNSLVKDDE